MHPLLGLCFSCLMKIPHTTNLESSGSSRQGSNIIVFCLPPHTTQSSQPLDNGCFGPLKKACREEYQKYCFDNPGRVVTRVQFSLFFNRAWNQNGEYTIRVSILQDLSRDAQWPKVSLRKLQSFIIDKITGLKYIPLYSPVRPSLEFPFTPKFSVHKVLE